MSSRKAQRAAIQTLLQGLAFGSDKVYRAPRRAFSGLSPVAVIASAGEANTWEAAEILQNTYRYSVTMYVRADAGGEDAAEDTLDDLRDSVGGALRTAGYMVGESDAAPDGAPLRNIDGVLYRAERIPVAYEDY